MTKEKITICIPTKDRSDFLSRLLHYFVDTKYQHWIFIGDSSNDFHLQKTKKTIQSLKNKLKIRYFECPGLSPTVAYAHITQFITTPYCTFLPDDDFLCPKGIDKCIDFLEHNSNYSAAHGFGIGMIGVKGAGPYDKIKYVHYYQQATLSANSGSFRLRDYFSSGPYTIQHSVFRTQNGQDVFGGEGFSSPARWTQSDFIFDELIPSAVSSIRNRVKELDCLYLVRFGHDETNVRLDTYDWFCNPNWFPGLKNMRDKVINELMRQDSISKKEAEEVFKQALWPFFCRILSPPHQPYRLRALTSIVEKIDRQIPGFRKVCRKSISHFQSHFQTKKENNLLPSLLKSTSPYHSDFMPIYRAITTVPIQKISKQN